jgi:hypothetical protein
MQTCKIRLTETEGLVLGKSNKDIKTTITNESQGICVTFSRFGRVLNHIEVGRDFSTLLSFGKELGVPQEGNFSVVTGRFEPHKPNGESRNTYNCIIVSFGHGNEFAFYEIHHSKESESFQLYNAIREVSLVAPREKVPS